MGDVPTRVRASTALCAHHTFEVEVFPVEPADEAVVVDLIDDLLLLVAKLAERVNDDTHDHRVNDGDDEPKQEAEERREA
jgi:hypothetical protein